MSCHLLQEPIDIIRVRKALVQDTELYSDGHFSRRVFHCKDCGQRYVMEFSEEVDFANGNDPQYITYVPVQNDEEIAVIQESTEPLSLRTHTPCICSDWPANKEDPHVYIKTN